MDLSSLSLDLGTTAPSAVGAAVPEQEGDTAWHSVAAKLDLRALTWKSATRKVREKYFRKLCDEGDADQRREAQTLSALACRPVIRRACRATVRPAEGCTLISVPPIWRSFFSLNNPPVVAGFAAHRFWTAG